MDKNIKVKIIVSDDMLEFEMYINEFLSQTIEDLELKDIKFLIKDDDGKEYFYAMIMYY